MKHLRVKDLPRAAYGTAAGLVAVLALLPALIYAAIVYQAQGAAVRTETEINAQLFTQIISSNPEMWRYERARLEGLLSRRPGDGTAEARRIRDMRGAVLVEHADSLGPPIITRSWRLYDSGAPVGRLEISRSLRPMAVRAGVLALVGLGFGTAVFLLLRVLPLAVVREALESQSREKGRAEVTLRSIGDGVVTTGTDCRIVFINRAAEAILGWSRKEAVGRPVHEVYNMPGCKGQSPCAIVPGGERGTTGGRRRTLVVRNGTERLVEESAAPIVGRQGRFVGCVLVFRDVTEKVRMEEELVRVQKLESLGILAGGIAHEIRNPLSGINIYLSALERLCEQSEDLSPDDRERITGITEQVRAASDKIAVIIKRIMEFAKPSPRLADKIDLNRSIEEASLLTATTFRQKGIALEKSLRPDLPGCVADARLMVQVLLNLVLNASHAVQSGNGEKRVAIASSVEDGRVVITVSDSGPGVPDHLREKIFDPFFTTKAEGSGIGLSFSRRVVAEHGGTLSVATGRWGGAEFRIELPVQRAANPS